jgi:hypothetical protein
VMHPAQGTVQVKVLSAGAHGSSGAACRPAGAPGGVGGVAAHGQRGGLEPQDLRQVEVAHLERECSATRFAHPQRADVGIPRVFTRQSRHPRAEPCDTASFAGLGLGPRGRAPTLTFQCWSTNRLGLFTSRWMMGGVRRCR